MYPRVSVHTFEGFMCRFHVIGECIFTIKTRTGKHDGKQKEPKNRCQIADRAFSMFVRVQRPDRHIYTGKRFKSELALRRVFHSFRCLYSNLDFQSQTYQYKIAYIAESRLM